MPEDGDVNLCSIHVPKMQEHVADILRLQLQRSGMECARLHIEVEGVYIESRVSASGVEHLGTERPHLREFTEVPWQEDQNASFVSEERLVASWRFRHVPSRYVTIFHV